MKRSRKEVARSREKVLAAGSRLFRERGVEGARVADVMEAAGLTHGAFYTYFASKDDLVREAIALAFRDTIALWGAGRPEGSGTLDHLLDTYLSIGHVRNVGAGCAAAAPGPELHRASGEVRRETANGVQNMVDALAGTIAGKSRQQREQAALGSVAAMVGALVVARLQPDELRAQAVLDAVRTLVGRST